MSYEEGFGRKHDFEVKYRFLSQEEGGRKSGAAYQGYRSDWSYDGDDIQKTGIYMIYPEFENEKGEVLAKDEQASIEGAARMWILDNQLKETIHRDRLKIGVKGYFMEGGRRVAEAEVTKLVDIKN